MKKVYFLVMGVVIAGTMTSCRVSESETTARCVEPKVTELYADLEVKNVKTMGECTWEGRKKDDVDKDELMRIAVYNALQPHKADVLIAPQYRFQEDVLTRKRVKVTVTGYPACYTNFRHSAALDSLEVMQLDSEKTYLLKTKNSDGQTVGYQVMVPVDKEVHTLDIEQATLDKIILNGADQPMSIVPTTHKKLKFNKDGQINPSSVIDNSTKPSRGKKRRH